MLVSIASIGFFSQLQSIAVEKGLTASMAALMISLLALSVIPSRLLVGWALDLADPRIAGAAALMLGAAGALTVFLAPHAAVWLIALGVVLIGASIGAEFDLMSFFCARFFGLRNYALIYGLLMGFFYIGFAGGGIGYGLVHDHSGSYLGALAGAALFLAIASGLLLALPSRSVTSGPPSEVALGSN
jgi:MFS family permease